MLYLQAQLAQTYLLPPLDSFQSAELTRPWNNSWKAQTCWHQGVEIYEWYKLIILTVQCPNCWPPQLSTQPCGFHGHLKLVGVYFQARHHLAQMQQSEKANSRRVPLSSMPGDVKPCMHLVHNYVYSFLVEFYLWIDKIFGSKNELHWHNKE